MDDLRICPAVDEQRRLAGQEAGGGRVRRRVGERERHALEVVDPLAELDALRRPVDRQGEEPLHRPGAAGADVDALLDEPLVRQLVRPADAAEDRRRRSPDVAQDELRVAVGEGVGVARVMAPRHARRVVVDEEQRRPPLATGHDVAVEDHEVGVRRPRDEPFLAVQDVFPGRPVLHSRRFEASRVRSGTGLGDRVAPVPLTAQARLEVAPALLLAVMD